MKGSIQYCKNSPSTCIFNNWEEKTPKYCVVIPTYKRPHLLIHTIESVRNQEFFSNYEILIADNNPERNDITETFLKEKYNLKGIAYFKHNENLGLAGNWNKLILLSRSEILVMVHDDDMLYPDFFRNVDPILNDFRDVACLYASCKHSHIEDGNLLPRTEAPFMNLIELKYSDFALWNCAGPPCGMVFRRDVALEIKGFDPSFYPVFDLAFHSCVAKSYKCLKLVGYPLACYRWLDNITLKPGVLEGCAREANIITKEIVSNTKILLPRSIKKRFLNTSLTIALSSLAQEKYKLSIFDILCYKITRFVYRFPMKIRENLAIKKYRIK